MHSFSFEAIGTQWTVDIPEENNRLIQEILRLIASFDNTYSRFRKDSTISKISNKIGRHKAPADFLPLKEIYEKLYFLTDGLFTPLVGSLLEDAGYDSTYSLIPKTLKPIGELGKSVIFADLNIDTLEPITLDFGACGKGYLVDKVAHLISKKGVKNYCIDAGGDILVKDTEVTRIGLEHPEDAGKVIGVAEIKNMSICSSSGNRRKWGSYHHILNPKTLKPADEIIATWVVAEKTIDADALATALFLLPKPERYKDFKFEYVMLYKDYSAIKSLNFPGQLFTA